jgi:hypothetical protein
MEIKPESLLRNRNFILILALILGLLWEKGAQNNYQPDLAWHPQELWACRWPGVSPFQQEDFRPRNCILRVHDCLHHLAAVQEKLNQ